MRRILIPLTLLLLACQTVSQIQQVTTATQTDTPTVTITVTSTPVITPSPHPTAKPQAPAAFTVRIHPDDGLYVGDLVSFEVVAPEKFKGNEIEISIDLPNGPVFGPQPFGPTGLLGQPQATFHWVWDTSDMEPGEYTLTFRVLEDETRWEQTVTLFPEDALPPYALDTLWESAASQCCIIYYLSNTSSQRDLQAVLAEVDQQAAHVSQIMGFEFKQSPTVVLMPRVLGHGGYASGEIYISYLDRNYAGSSLGQVLHHELVHILDREDGGEFLPTMLVEGLAVYLSGGHFKPEPLIPRAAALLELDWYIPITTLADGFYSHQHEIGYLEAGALIEFMVDKWGWEAFDNFYRTIARPDNNLHSDAINAALRQHFDISLAELDAQFFNALQNHPIDPNLKADVQTTVAYYDTVRRYQQMLDTSAYFGTAWFLDIDDLLEYDISADFVRHPEFPENIALEAMLVSAYIHLSIGEYTKSEHLLAAINAVLAQIDQGHPVPFHADALAANYLTIINMLLEQGYRPQHIQIKENSARVLALADGPELIELNLEFENSVWSLK